MYRLRAFSTYENQQLQNVFYYLADNVTATAQDLCEAFIEKVIPDWSGGVADTLEFTAVEAEKIGSVSDFHTESVSVFGTASSVNSSPPFVTLNVRLIRSDKSTRHGRKAISGFDRLIIQSDGSLNPTFAAAVQSRYSVFANTITKDVGALASYSPNIVRFSPVNPDVIIASNPISGTLVTGASTQNSRKSYKGD